LRTVLRRSHSRIHPAPSCRSGHRRPGLSLRPACQPSSNTFAQMNCGVSSSAPLPPSRTVRDGIHKPGPDAEPLPDAIIAVPESQGRHRSHPSPSGTTCQDMRIHWGTRCLFRLSQPANGPPGEAQGYAARRSPAEFRIRPVEQAARCQNPWHRPMPKPRFPEIKQHLERSRDCTPGTILTPDYWVRGCEILQVCTAPGASRRWQPTPRPH
jgi:hypothetical protein